MADAPALSRIFGRLVARKKNKFGDASGFRLDSNRINIAHAGVFDADPANFIRIFALADESNVEIHPDALKRLRSSLGSLTRKSSPGQCAFSEG
jgi:[protein-PII] uridylyltransferase